MHTQKNRTTARTCLPSNYNSVIHGKFDTSLLLNPFSVDKHFAISTDQRVSFGSVSASSVFVIREFAPLQHAKWLTYSTEQCFFTTFIDSGWMSPFGPKVVSGLSRKYMKRLERNKSSSTLMKWGLTHSRAHSGMRTSTAIQVRSQNTFHHPSKSMSTKFRAVHTPLVVAAFCRPVPTYWGPFCR